VALASWVPVRRVSPGPWARVAGLPVGGVPVGGFPVGADPVGFVVDELEVELVPDVELVAAAAIPAVPNIVPVARALVRISRRYFLGRRNIGPGDVRSMGVRSMDIPPADCGSLDCGSVDMGCSFVSCPRVLPGNTTNLFPTGGDTIGPTCASAVNLGAGAHPRSRSRTA
jgi:hypothetical protein